MSPFFKENPEYVVKNGSTGKLKLKASLSKCGRTSVIYPAECSGDLCGRGGVKTDEGFRMQIR